MTVPAILYVLTLGVHFLAAALLIGVILVQGGKGASMAASFTGGGGGGSNLSYTDEMMLRATRWSAGIFLVTSVSLTLLGERATSAVQRATPSSFEQRGFDAAAPAAAPAAEAAPTPAPEADAPSEAAASETR